jgi:hypothetical protein
VIYQPVLEYNPVRSGELAEVVKQSIAAEFLVSRSIKKTALILVASPCRSTYAPTLMRWLRKQIC